MKTDEGGSVKADTDTHGLVAVSNSTQFPVNPACADTFLAVLY